MDPPSLGVDALSEGYYIITTLLRIQNKPSIVLGPDAPVGGKVVKGTPAGVAATAWKP